MEPNWRRYRPSLGAANVPRPGTRCTMPWATRSWNALRTVCLLTW
jgi:hypothetical protein